MPDCCGCDYCAMEQKEIVEQFPFEIHITVQNAYQSLNIVFTAQTSI